MGQISHLRNISQQKTWANYDDAVQAGWVKCIIISP